MKTKIKKEITLETIASSITRMGDSIIKMEDSMVKMESRLESKIEDLALATAKGFSEVDKKFEEVNKKIDYTERTLSGKITGVDRRLDDLAFNRANKDEVYLLTKRMTRLEAKVGIKS